MNRTLFYFYCKLHIQFEIYEKEDGEISVDIKCISSQYSAFNLNKLVRVFDTDIILL